MLSTICSSITPRTTSPWISQPFRSYTLSCVKCQAYSDIQRPSRAFYQNMKTYPEVYELFRASNYRVTKEVWAKIRAEPELLRVRQEEGRYHHNIKLRSTDVESRAKTQKVKSAYWQAHKQDDALVRYKYMFSWCFGMVDRSKDAWVRENLPWKSHRPVYQHEPDYRFYTCCGMARYMKTGWQSKSDPSEFLCNKHYTKRGWDLAMPEGYEDVRTFKELRTRYEELNPGSSPVP